MIGTVPPPEDRRAIEVALLAAMDHRLIPSTEIGQVGPLAGAVRSGRSLTVPELRHVWRAVHRVRVELAAIGVTFPGAPVVEAPVAVRSGRRPEVLIQADGRLAVVGAPFAANAGLRNGLYGHFDKRTLRWLLPPTPIAAAGVVALLAGTDPEVSGRVVALAAEHGRLGEHRAVLHPDNPVPGLDMSGLVLAPLWEHQVRGVVFASSVSASLLAMPMGSGKSATAIATVNRVDARRVVIVAPNKVRAVWPREVARWSARSWHLVDGKRPSRQRGHGSQDLSLGARLAELEQCLFDCRCPAAVHAAVVNYEMLSQEPLASWVPHERLDVVVYDEIHRVKSAVGKSSKVAARWVDFSRRRIGLSGTPFPQYPWDAFGVLRALEPGLFGSVWTPFKAKYVESRVNRETGRVFPVGIRPEVRGEFAAKVHSITYIPDVDLKLPPVTHAVREVVLEPAARRVYATLDREMFADLAAFARGEQAVLTPKNILSRMIRLMQLTGGTVPDNGEHGPDGTLVRQAYRVSRAKADMLAHILDEVGCVGTRAEADREPVVVYAQFRSDLDAIAEVAAQVGVRYAEISGRRADGLTSTSLLAPEVDVVGVQIQAGGTGVDLTRSRYGVWYSAGYSVGDHDQALKRQDRPGQTRPVVFTYLVAADTIDTQIYEGLSQRRSAVAVFLRSRGVDPAAVGMVDDVIPDGVVDRSGRSGGAVILPWEEPRFEVESVGVPAVVLPAGLSAAEAAELGWDDL